MRRRGKIEVRHKSHFPGGRNRTPELVLPEFLARAGHSVEIAALAKVNRSRLVVDRRESDSVSVPLEFPLQPTLVHREQALSNGRQNIPGAGDGEAFGGARASRETPEDGGSIADRVNRPLDRKSVV